MGVYTHVHVRTRRQQRSLSLIIAPEMTRPNPCLRTQQADRRKPRSILEHAQKAKKKMKIFIRIL